MDMSNITECNAAGCAFNKDGRCHAIAVTIGSRESSCDTYLPGGKKGGLEDVTAGVGACKMANCMFNKSLECTANGIKVATHASHADCMTFRAR